MTSIGTAIFWLILALIGIRVERRRALGRKADGISHFHVKQR